MLQFYNFKFYIQILQLQTSPDQFLVFLVKVKAVLLLLITSGVLFHSMLPLKSCYYEFLRRGHTVNEAAFPINLDANFHSVTFLNPLYAKATK